MRGAINIATSSTGLFGLAGVSANLFNSTTGTLFATVPLLENQPGIYGAADVEIPITPVPIPPVTGKITTTAPVSNDIDIVIDLGITVSVSQRYYTGSNVLTALTAILGTLLPAQPFDEKTDILPKQTRCPYCFSKIKSTKNVIYFEWDRDPILLKGAKVNFLFRGFQAPMVSLIKDLQDNRTNLELYTYALSPKTDFTPLVATNQNRNISKQIMELRYSTERLLWYYDMTKDTYFNYDENGIDRRVGNHQDDWYDTSGNTLKSDGSGLIDLAKVNIIYSEINRKDALLNRQVKGLHIEDLRHQPYLQFKEDWSNAAIGTSTVVAGTQHKIWSQNPVTVYSDKTVLYTGANTFTYFWAIYPVSFGPVWRIPYGSKFKFNLVSCNILGGIGISWTSYDGTGSAAYTINLSSLSVGENIIDVFNLSGIKEYYDGTKDIRGVWLRGVSIFSYAYQPTKTIRFGSMEMFV